MTVSYFTNLESIVKGQLLSAEKSLKIAVAWINLKIYYEIIHALLSRGVKIKIIMDDNPANRRNQSIIDALVNNGTKVKMVNFGGIMHHKFCVIDKRICLFGSFNWTANANIRNIEDLNISDEVQVVNSYLLEFKALWELSKDDIGLLRNPRRCPNCASPVFNIMLMEEEGDYQTKITVFQQCSGMCSKQIIYVDYFDVSVINNYLDMLHLYDDELEQLSTSFPCDYNTQTRIAEIEAERDFCSSTYLSSVRHNRMDMPIIHAVAIKGCTWINKDDGYFIYKIVWKERGTENYIDDEYPIE